MGSLLNSRLLKGRRKWIVGGLVAFLLFSAGSVEMTSQSSFCNSCHIMKPYYASWKSSAHKEVKCVECHIEPGVTSFVSAKLNGLGQVVDDVLHRTSTKPSASVSQLSCTRSGCHTVETLSAKEVDNGLFKFQHGKHLGAKHLGVEISCGTCHSHVKGDEHFEVNTDVCVTCHLVQNGTAIEQLTGGAQVIRMSVRPPTPAGRSPTAHPAHPGEKVPPNSCVTCHDPPEGEIEHNGLKFDHAQFLGYGAACESCHRGVTATPPPIEDGRCLECHTFGVDRSLDSREMHSVHTLGRHKIECSSCHGWIQHGLAVQTASLEALDCRRCHTDQHNTQRDTYFHAPASDAGGVQAMSPMFLAHVDCTGCHTSDRPVDHNPTSGATVAAASAQSCDACHAKGLGDQMIPLWQNATHTLFDQVVLRIADAEAAGVPADAIAEARRLLELVRVDGSWGVHNPKYTQQLLERARDLASPRPAAPPVGEGDQDTGGPDEGGIK